MDLDSILCDPDSILNMATFSIGVRRFMDWFKNSCVLTLVPINYTWDKYAQRSVFDLVSHLCVSGAWWLSGNIGALHPEGRMFESHTSHHVWTLGKSFA